MKTASQMGLKNRTGLQTSPKHSKELMQTLEGVEGAPDQQGGGQAMGDMRDTYIVEAEPLGSIPTPLSVKGVAKSGAKLASGNRPQVFMDKLAERCAFERSGTRLYDGMLAKFRAQSHLARGERMPQSISDQALLKIREEEAAHFRLLVECIEQLGGDPTAQTPSADLVGVESIGLLQAISDPRTSLVQCLHTSLAAELIDNAGWELLGEMAREMGYDQMATRFADALTQEEEHLQRVRGWYSEMSMAESANA